MSHHTMKKKQRKRECVSLSEHSRSEKATHRDVLEETKPATVESSVNAQAWGREGRTGGARRISRAAGPPCVTLQWSTRDITRLSRLAERTPPRTDPSCTRWDAGDAVSAQSPPAANGPSGGDVGGGEGQEGRGKSPHLPRDSAVKPNLLQKVNFRPATKPPLCLFPKFWPLRGLRSACLIPSPHHGRLNLKGSRQDVVCSPVTAALPGGSDIHTSDS